MDTPSNDFVFPVPNIIEIHHKDQRKMDQYIEAFPATQHGYCIRIGHSNSSCALSHYECYQSSYPPGGPAAVGTTKSVRIECPFKIDTRYLSASNSWLLIYAHLGHNHPPDFNVKPRKKHKDPKDKHILAPGVTLNNDDDDRLTEAHPCDIIVQHLISPSSVPNHLTKLPPHIGPTTKSTLTNQKANSKTKEPASHHYQPQPPSHNIKHRLQSPDLLDLTMSRVTDRLRAMTPRCQQDALLKIQSIITQALPPMVSFKPHEHDSNCKPELFDPTMEAELVHNEDANVESLCDVLSLTNSLTTLISSTKGLRKCPTLLSTSRI
ncbi:uncharacterized protein MELLADRAFT_94233 [Melampsora larici-populina 98AG31]|uniref:Uncharacterized protein n=1 Tax=Melampsora larici-populina (strain 98AG31 / pathotype 3-4-7) TaxID=747676 RepID=F4S6Z1_MELLP|nr:uncharacterized protein MELLADRAFT_94233 [Melampsora larici-populina 98AG31]EGF99544.1 hypothetical protein MELLADRAFT_94233 [Melampsora larici-populina 98AG31]